MEPVNSIAILSEIDFSLKAIVIMLGFIAGAILIKKS